MADVRPSRGFSLVELLVALVFTMLLMTGMASVFKASLGTFYGSGEKLSSERRNRMSIDLIGEDLNNAGMYLADLATPPSVSSDVPPFRLVPNPSTISGVTQGADELYFYMDEPLPFEGTLSSSAASVKTAAELVASESAASASDYTYTVDCQESSYAKMVKVGQTFIFKDSWDSGYVSSVSASGSAVTVVAGTNSSASITGSGSLGIPSKAKHLTGSGVMFIKPAQLVKYSIQLLKLDPDPENRNPNGIPCLVRDQGAYSTSGFTADTTLRQIVSENVTGFRVYMSADSGRNWIGGSAYTTWAAIRAAIDSQLATVGRADYTTTQNSEHWFRSIPVIVRVDVTTRTANPRTEFSDSATPTLAYKEQTQSLVMVPRHFGLSMN
ncbi:PilW family protein [Holophaga foetida]|uniref:PilW family protein n=1 Tax=Holophaga foetida TaxID=35839 RepID=UPI0002472F67|nr:hypothetical protein [Holophaga foetida]